MNTKVGFWGLLGARLVAFAAEDGAGSGAPAAGDAGAGAAGEGGAAAADPAAPSSLASAAFAGDEKPQDGEAPAGEKSEGDEAPAEFDPASFDVEVPEDLKIHEEAFGNYKGAVQGWLKDNPKATAADALKWAAGYQADAVKAQQSKFLEGFNSTIKGWEDQCVSDPRLGGGDAEKFEAVKADYYAGLKAIGTPALVKVLDESGLGSHPEIVAAFTQVGRSAKESPILGGEGGKGSVSFADALYGKKR